MRKKKGFTMVELMLVISVMAIIATLSVGAILKATKNAREKRIVTMRFALKSALMSYQGQKGVWPVKLEPEGTNNIVYFTSAKNADVFKELLPRKNAKQVYYLSTSELLTKPSGHGVMSLRQALDKNLSPIPLGYARHDKQSEFHFFRVEFNIMTDHVTVENCSQNPNDDDAQKRCTCLR